MIGNCDIRTKKTGNNIDGYTVFATCDIKKGDIVCYICGTVFSDGEKYKPKSGLMFNKKKLEGLYVFALDDGKSIDPGKAKKPKNKRHITHISAYVNHSCRPNCKFDFSPNNKTQLAIFATRNIKKDEEITINYGGKRWFNSFGLQCKCHKCKTKRAEEKNIQSKKQRKLEGIPFEIKVNYFNRSRKLREEALQRANYRCEICGDSLEEIYGSEWAGQLMHVHHVNPVHTGKRMNSSDDLLTICPNCHAVLHHHFPKPNEESINLMIDMVKSKKQQ